MDYTTWTVDPSELCEPIEHAVMSLYEAFQGVPDTRRAQGKRYELALILCLLVLAN